MICVTGDTHGNFERFVKEEVPELYACAEQGEQVYLIICGDFGGIWDESYNNVKRIQALKQLPFTILFIDGNHENFDLLKYYERVDYMGGKAHKIADNIYHLMRGYVFEIEGKKLFCMGGAKSHDVQDGILDRANFKDDITFMKTWQRWYLENRQFRVNHYTWWKEEMPSSIEMKRGLKSLEQVGYKVDYVISHSLPSKVLKAVGYEDTEDSITTYFDQLVDKLEFGVWFSGHYHIDGIADAKHLMNSGLSVKAYRFIYEDIVQLI